MIANAPILSAMTLTFPAFTAGMLLSLSLIMAIGPQNAHILRMGLQRQHLWTTIALCALSDIVLIALGVWGLAQLGGLSGRLHGALIGAGVLFLLFYGWMAFRRILHPTVDGSVATAPEQAVQAQSMTNRQAVGYALAFSWLNPHAWLDTAVLIGTASLAYGASSAVFGLGAMTGSVVWFVAFGTTAFWLGRRLHSLRIWRALDGLVALMMWTMAGLLVKSLF